MECLKVKELLNEYIDGTLDTQLKELLESHLSGCNNCTQELNSLKAYLKTVGSLEKVEAPENFIEKLNERLQDKAQSEDVTRKIFTPMKIKLSFKFAGALATVLFIVFLAQRIHMVDRITVAQLPKNEIVVDKSVGRDKLTREKTVVPSEKIQQEQAPLSLAMEKGKISSSTISGTKPIELVLLINTDIKDIGTYSRMEPVSLQVTTAGLVKEGSKDEWEAKSSHETEISKTDVDEINRKTLEYKTSIPLQIKNILESSGGRILSVTQDSNNAQPQYIYVEILQGNYGELLKSLNQLTEFQKPSPSVIKAEENLIQIRIKLTPSQ